MPGELAEVDQLVEDLLLRVEAALLGHVAEAAAVGGGDRPAVPAAPRRRGCPSRPMIIRIVVVLPAPLPPTKPVSLPRGTSNETSSTTVTSPNRRVSPRVWIMAPTLGTATADPRRGDRAPPRGGGSSDLRLERAERPLSRPRPARWANTTACTRSRRCSLARQFETWVFTVASPSTSRAAISALLSPSPEQLQHLALALGQPRRARRRPRPAGSDGAPARRSSRRSPGG